MRKFEVFIGTARGSKYSNGPAVVDRASATVLIVRHLGRSGILGATILETLGVWQGEVEPGFKVEILANEDDAENVVGFAYYLGRELRQDTILIHSAERTAFIDTFGNFVQETAKLA